ncbi:hypothetical protein C4J81_08125 [Deltaproteobacteria bacterium Smac51]|nr:hypothetical protein C4J81_08125 [Deltaproteobacteria bacterium Smac51]
MTRALKSRHVPDRGRHPWKHFIKRRLNWIAEHGLYSQLALVGLLTAVTVLLAFPTPVRYQVGDVAEYTIRADRGLSVVDHAATQHNMAAAESAVPPVFVLDDAVIPVLEEEAATIFRRGRELVAAMERPTSGSASIQISRELESLEVSFNSLFHVPDSDSRLWRLALESHFRPDIARQVLSLASEIMAMGLLEAPNYLAAGQRQRPVSIVLMSSRSEYTLPTAAALMDRSAVERLMEIRGRVLTARFTPDEVELIMLLARGLARPNLKPDFQETERRLAEARAQVPISYMNIRAGEVIVREGSVIGMEAMEKIKAMRETASSYNWLYKFAGLFVVLFVFFNSGLILSLINRQQGGYHRIALKEQIFISLQLVMVALMAHSASLFGASLSWDFDFVDSRTILYAMPISTATMLTAVFFGVRKASFMALFAAMVATIVSPTGKFMVFVYSYNGAIAATWCLRNMNERGHLIPASFWVMVVNCLTLFGLTLYGDLQWTRQTSYNFCAAAASGVLSGVMASGMIPLIESAFGFSTNLKLLELGNLDRPLLRELMLTAPGTYHHSVIVGAMVEAAAEAIGANPHLARVGAYYHDIGKMKKPLYFVENQTGENRHDTLAPSMSALILIGHVKDGAELARENHLPQGIVDIVEQHHGTGLMGFFYHKAKEQRQEGQPEVNEGDYRYPGPRPQAKEAGLVMLADICEAATRSLSEPTPTKIRNMVRQLVNSVFSDGQLDDCELTGREISEVINNFTTILIGIYHHRVAYPGGRKDAAKEKEATPALKKEPVEPKAEPKEIYGHLPVEPSKGVTH